MSVIALKEQAPNQIIDIAPFPKETEAYPEGARAKASFIWPKSADQSYAFCIPSWLYMFKISRKAYPEQFWVEIFAYQLGCLIGVPVPPAFVAYDSSNENIAGALIEWFYDQNEDAYMRGGDVMTAMIDNYDRVKGLQHNLQTIFEFLKPLEWGTPHWLKEWAKILIFDALIGNRDRHQENWGIITKYGLLDENSRAEKTKGAILKSKMSPAFDNGTSMGHEIFERDFHKFNIERYVSHGIPHILWDLNQQRKNQINHENFIGKFVNTYPDCRDDMISCLQFSEDQVKTIFQKLTSFEIEPRLTNARAQFMTDLLLYRQNKLLLVLDN